jgi:hypothetical protein
VRTPTTPSSSAVAWARARLDFYSEGNVLQIVDDLNGVGPVSNDDVVAAS